MDVKVTGAAEYGRYVKALICGDPGAGKTLISSTFPHPFYASAEGGLMSIADRKIPYAEIRSSGEMAQIRMLMSQPPDVRERTLGFPVETLVVDTVDEVQKILLRERTEASKSGAMELKDWGWLGDQMRTIVRSFRNLDMNVVLTCHLKKDRDEETGRISFRPGLQGAFGDEVAGYVDLALLLKSKSVLRNVNGASERVLERALQTYQDVNHPWIKDRSGKLASDVPVNFRDDFARLHAAIFGQLDDIPPTPTPVAITTTDVAAPSQAETPELEVRTEVPPTPAEPTEIFTCEECGAAFDSKDQAELSQIRVGRTLDKGCYKQAVSAAKPATVKS